MTDCITLKAPAKLNLSLDVTGKLPDGYHAMKMIMSSVTLADEISLRLTAEGSVSAASDLSYIPSDGRNLACRAARLFLDHIGETGAGAEIRLTKHIPVGAGMAGGSADAAAVLLGLNELTGSGLSADALCDLGAQLGSDVPYCIRGGTMLAEGRGDLLSPLPAMPDCSIVICKPPFPISTPKLFAKLNWRKIRCRPDTAALIAALENGDLPRLARRMYNVFEDVLPPQYKEVLHIKSCLLELGALGAVMTGTGSAVFGLFDDPGRAAAAREALSADYRECFLTAPKR